MRQRYSTLTALAIGAAVVVLAVVFAALQAWS